MNYVLVSDCGLQRFVFHRAAWDKDTMILDRYTRYGRMASGKPQVGSWTASGSSELPIAKARTLWKQLVDNGATKHTCHNAG